MFTHCSILTQNYPWRCRQISHNISKQQSKCYKKKLVCIYKNWKKFLFCVAEKVFQCMDFISTFVVALFVITEHNSMTLKFLHYIFEKIQNLPRTNFFRDTFNILSLHKKEHIQISQQSINLKYYLRSHRCPKFLPCFRHFVISSHFFSHFRISSRK